MKQIEINDPVSICADPALVKFTRKRITEFIEVELEIGDFILFAIKDSFLKSEVCTAFLTVKALCKANPFCKFSQESLVEFVMNHGDLLDSRKKYYTSADLIKYVKTVGVYFTEATMTTILKNFVLSPDKITMEEMRSITLLLLKKPELRDVFKKYCPEYGTQDSEEVMNFEQFNKFLEEVQGDSIDRRFYQEMVSQLKNPQSILGIPRSNTSQYLSCIEFSNVVFSDFNLVMNPQMSKIYQDMDRPLSQYFICSLDNAYKVGQGVSSKPCMGFYEALKYGARNLEIDTYDGADGNPVVACDKNLSDMMLFEDFLKCIGKWAFKHSDYPLTLFIENHCSVDQMIKMKKMINNYLAESVYRVTEKEFMSEKFPSPMKLLKKVIVKTKSAYSHKKFVDKLQERDTKRELEGRQALNRTEKGSVGPSHLHVLRKVQAE